jgi:hypothetical protein
VKLYLPPRALKKAFRVITPDKKGRGISVSVVGASRTRRASRRNDNNIKKTARSDSAEDVPLAACPEIDGSNVKHKRALTMTMTTVKVAKTKSKGPNFLKRWSSLNWTSPLNAFPHGLSGSVIVFVGAFFLVQALFLGPNTPGGYDVTGPQPRSLFYTFIAACAINAAAGLMITKKAPEATQMPFYIGGATQLSLTWFAFRFSLDASTERGYYDVIISLLDKFCGLILVFVNLMFFYLTIFPDKSKTPFLVKLPLLFGSLAFSLTCFYPWQMAWFGKDWFACVLDQYPYQRAGFVSYVYVPTLFANACIWFGLTLYLRKIMPPGVTAVVFFLFVLGTLIFTVLTQEVHISEVSTQKLILICQDEEVQQDGWLVLVASALDTSSLARNVLKALGIPLLTPPAY